MTKEGFLAGLRKSLEDTLEPREIENHISYYRNYIEDEIRSGRSESDVINELGDPWVIAKSIKDMTEAGIEYQSDADSENEERYNKRERRQDDDGTKFIKKLKWTSIAIGIVLLIAFIGIFALVFSAVGHLLILLPRLIVVLVPILFVVRIIKNMRR